MSGDRITWTDVDRACRSWVAAARSAGHPGLPARAGDADSWQLWMTRGNATQGHAARLDWMIAPFAGTIDHGSLPTPGGRTEFYRSARDTYQYITASTATLLDFAAATRKANR